MHLCKLEINVNLNNSYLWRENKHPLHLHLHYALMGY